MRLFCYISFTINLINFLIYLFLISLVALSFYVTEYSNIVRKDPFQTINLFFFIKLIFLYFRLLQLGFSQRNNVVQVLVCKF